MSNVELTTGDLEAILRQHHIPAREWGRWSALVYAGQRPGAAPPCSLAARQSRGRIPTHLAGVVGSLLAEDGNQVPSEAPRLVQSKLSEGRAKST